MIHYELLQDDGIIIVIPEGRLESTDFEALGLAVDPYIEEHGKLKGLMIYVESFPGWADFAGLLSHIRFVKNHQQDIDKVAAVTDSSFLSIMPRVANHFIKATVKHFDYNEKDTALGWLKNDAD